MRRAVVVAVVVALALVVAAELPSGEPEERVGVANSSLEDGGGRNRTPTCWQTQTTGTNAATFAPTSRAHSGRRAERLTVAHYRSGHAALVVRMADGCAPRAQPGRSYRLSVWFRGSGALRLVANYLGPGGLWRVWQQSSLLAPARGWTRAAFSTTYAPRGAVALSFGLQLGSNGTVVTDDYALQEAGVQPRSGAPPPQAGYFTELVPVGGYARLPGDAECARRVHYSNWEPRPDNTSRNHNLVDPAALHASFRARPRSGKGTYSTMWDTWLLPRVDGQFAGTTDEIIQWAACKWGLPDNYLRAEADVESTWYQYEVLGSRQCVERFGCGDRFVAESDRTRLVYCAGLAELGGYDYRRDYGPAACPKTFSIAGVMSWWNPEWGYDWPMNQNGTFPFTRDSTAAAMDYLASQIRGCYEGWELQLGKSYRAGDLWGCAGAWYSGVWHSPAAEQYIAKVRSSMQRRPWLEPGYARQKPPCTDDGCPVGG